MTWGGERWQDKRLWATLLRVAVFVVPILAGVVTGTLVARALPEPSGWAVILGWWIAVIAVSMATLFIVDRLARRLLPLATLLRLSLVFPDEAPSRFGVMLRANSPRTLERRVAEAREQGLDDDPIQAAEIILSLASALNHHDKLTRGHAERTRAFTDLLAEELGLSEEDQDRLRWAALLHDIGKLEVPAEVLNAGHGLEDEEWDAVRQHPRIGYELTRPIHGFLGEWAETINHHHERWDGSGYPYGLERKDIAYGARIVAVADAYDAMTAFRSYQPAMSAADARLELAEGSGSQFDPTVVRAFLSVAIGRLRRIAGPLTLIGQLPFTDGLRRLGDAAGAMVAALAVFVAVVVSGIGIIAGQVPSLADLFAEVDADLVSVPVVLAAGDGRFDPAGIDAATIEVVEQPNHGTLTIDKEGRLTFQRTESFEGTDEFSVQVCDVDGDCGVVALVVDPGGDIALADAVLAAQAVDPPPSTTTAVPPATSSPATAAPTTSPATTAATTTTGAPATTGTTSTPPGTAPTTTRAPRPPSGPTFAVDDAAWTLEDQAVVIDVLANDADPNGSLDKGSLSILTGPSRGDAIVTAGKLMYFPDANATGSDAFTYEVCGTSGTCGTAKVAVAVVPVNDPPVALGDTVTSEGHGPVSINVIANDQDPDGDQLTVVDHDDGSALGGTVTCGSSSCTYTPPTLWPGPDTFDYTIADVVGALSTATVTITPLTPDTGWTLSAAGPGDQTSTPVLPLELGGAPAANTSVPNFDTDRDTRPGLLLREVPTGIGTQFAESDPAKYQLWRGESGAELVLRGDAFLELHAAMAGFQADEAGVLRVFVLDCSVASTTGADCTQITMAAVEREPWTETAGVWEPVTFTFGAVDHVIPASRVLALKLVVANSDDDMRVAFDTVGYEARFTVQP